MNITAESVNLATIEELTAFLKYNPKVQKSVISGFVLFEDIVSEGGGKLFAKGLELDDEKVAKLIQIKEKFETDFAVSLERNNSLHKILSKRLLSLFKSMLSTRAARSEFRKMMEKIEKSSINHLTEIFDNENLVMMLYETYFIESSVLKKGKPIYFYHMLNTVIFSMAITIESIRAANLKLTTDDIKNIMVVALLNNFCSLQTVRTLVEMNEDQRKPKYFELNKGNFEIAKQLKFEIEIAEALEKSCYYHLKETQFLEGDKKSDLYASIVVTADLFDQRISGFFQNPSSPKDATDRLYVLANQKELSKTYVDVLAQGLKFTDLFDFYNEVERLIDMCLFKRSAKPYPMTGFLSSTLFVCGENIEKCKYFLGASKAINIIKRTSGLSEGSYGRCELLSPKLISFYEDHYEQIKDDVQEKQMEQMKGKPE